MFLKCCLASGCEDRAISAKSMSIACLCVCAEMSVNTPWSCVFCVRLSTLSATPALSTPLEDERHDEMNMHAKKCVSNLVFSFSLFFVLSLLFAPALLETFLESAWGPLGGILGASSVAILAQGRFGSEAPAWPRSRSPLGTRGSPWVSVLGLPC